MPVAAHTFWLALLVVTTSIWLGGYVAMAVVARASAKSLEPAVRVAFFRALGRAYLPVGAAALAVGFISGGVLLRQRPVDVLSIAAVLIAVLLVVCLGVAVAQARRMTRLRQQIGAAPDDERLQMKASSDGRAATALRALLGVLSLVLVVLGSMMAA
ncbi:MAG: hypothetical protein WC972_11850 [Trueperaceae bacterium]|jgi:ABC-type Fe3+ transport system permease subunit|nr:hypothetical protein [Truepera sp.]HRQ10552.1 hypothetical protein [Trueperaceae bacterium]